jgi:hypothetical protein
MRQNILKKQRYFFKVLQTFPPFMVTAITLSYLQQKSTLPDPNSFIHSFIQPSLIYVVIRSFCSLYYGRSLTSTKASSPDGAI